MSNPRFKLKTKTPCQIKVTQGETVLFDKEVPAGPFEIRIRELVPSPQGKFTLHVNGVAISSITLGAPPTSAN